MMSHLSNEIENLASILCDSLRDLMSFLSSKTQESNTVQFCVVLVLYNTPFREMEPTLYYFTNLKTVL